MHMTNEIITLFNRVFDEETGMDTYVPTVIRGVSVFVTMKSRPSTNGLVASDTCTVRVPIGADFSGKEYVEPKLYNDSDSQFTFLAGDLVVRGKEIDKVETSQATIKESYSNVYTVLGVSDNRRLGQREPHWKVMCS